jgi:hypothetical protein
MKTTVDESRRVLLPFEPGDVLDLERSGPDVVILKRVNQQQQGSHQLVVLNGELIGIGGPHVTTEDVRRMIEDEE